MNLIQRTGGFDEKALEGYIAEKRYGIRRDV